jgi:hypothetical protein
MMAANTAPVLIPRMKIRVDCIEYRCWHDVRHHLMAGFHFAAIFGIDSPGKAVRLFTARSNAAKWRHRRLCGYAWSKRPIALASFSAVRAIALRPNAQLQPGFDHHEHRRY